MLAFFLEVGITMEDLIRRPPEAAEYSYVGWVPCISGHLDFGLMSVGLVGNFIAKKIDKTPVTVNYASKNFPDSHCRRVVMQSWVDWRDRLQGDGEFRVVVLAEASDSANLDGRSIKGTLLMFPKVYSKQFVEYHDQILVRIHELHKRYEAFRKSAPTTTMLTHEWPSCQQDLNEKWDNLYSLVTSNKPLGPGQEVYSVDFLIDHYGFTYLDYRETELDVEYPLSAHDKYVITRQAFYYVKYPLHKHKHHAEESDALTTIVPHRVKEEKVFSTQILGQLKRELVRIKRTQRQNHRRQDDSEAVGILGYMQSLLASCLAIGFIDDDLYNRELNWLKGMELSFSAQNSRIKIDNDRRDHAGQVSRQWMAYILAFFTAFCVIWLNVRGGGAEQSDSPSDQISVLVNHYGVAAAAVFFVMLCVGWVVRWTKLLDLNSPRLLRRIKTSSWMGLLTVSLSVLLASAGALFFVYDLTRAYWLS
jgi:hypothetical protein